MFSYSGSRRLVLVILVVLAGVYLFLDSKRAKGEDTYASVDRSLEEYGKALEYLLTSYFKALQPGELSSAAIEGMLDDLDPYTQFLDKRALEQLRIDTQGKFGGLGITISHRTGVPTVMSVIEGTPADRSGLVVGDRIVGIGSAPTSEKNLQGVVDLLRGRPGTEVIITIERPGRAERFDQRIIRARVGIKSVQVTTMVEEGIGYIGMSGPHLSRFTETTPKELEEAVDALRARGLKGAILDLRGNPGGLLTQAVAVADKFLDPGRVVVSTRGRVLSQNREYRTQEPALMPGIPLIVLVNSQSASASEIVAGAIQDSDRGLILGTPTFGKGSVQTVRQVGKEKALKLTTALYYTPSGRSIHKAAARPHMRPMLSVGVKTLPAYEVVATIGATERREEAISELIDRFDLEPGEAEEVVRKELGQLIGLGLRDPSHDPKGGDTTKKFTTAGGRTVFGGGGITPDVTVEPAERPRLVIDLINAGLFFDFAVAYATQRVFPGEPDGFSLDEEVVDSFRAFVADSTKATLFRYRTAGEGRLAGLEEALKDADLYGEVSPGVFDVLKEVVEKERQAEFEKARPFIRFEIERELANRLWGNKAKLLVSLKGDKQFQEAVRIIKNRDLYNEKMKLALASGSRLEETDRTAPSPPRSLQ